MTNAPDCIITREFESSVRVAEYIITIPKIASSTVIINKTQSNSISITDFFDTLFFFKLSPTVILNHKLRKVLIIICIFKILQ